MKISSLVPEMDSEAYLCEKYFSYALLLIRFFADFFNCLIYDLFVKSLYLI